LDKCLKIRTPPSADEEGGVLDILMPETGCRGCPKSAGQPFTFLKNRDSIGA
jgi:hypothetical protein